ncbi:hypothetical protein ACLB2K_060601 [Fragaria x ananassa]
MGGNKFEGSTPSFSRAKNLEHIDHSSNMLNGNIPSVLFSLPSLESLYLSDNQFSEISNISSHSLKNLGLSINNLEEPISMSIFDVQGLKSLDLSSNNFNGSFPLNRLQHMRDLYFLDLSHNSLFVSHDATNFSHSYFPQFGYLGLASLKLRTFPHILRNQSKLWHLDHSDNHIHGKIPNWINRFRDLQELNLSCNSPEALEGPLINLTTLAFLDLRSNKLHGKIPIPYSLTIVYLDYSRNNFNSTIPTTIEDMLRGVNYLSLASNNLQGIIPGSICKSLYLEVLLTTPATTTDRMKDIVKASEGFVYLASTAGVTGARGRVNEQVKGLLKEIKEVMPSKAVAVGFGLSKPEHACEAGG